MWSLDPQRQSSDYFLDMKLPGSIPDLLNKKLAVDPTICISTSPLGDFDARLSLRILFFTFLSGWGEKIKR